VFHSDTYAYQLLVSPGALIAGLIACLIALFAIGCLLVGVRSANAGMLLIHLIVQASFS